MGPAAKEIGNGTDNVGSRCRDAKTLHQGVAAPTLLSGEERRRVFRRKRGERK
jgi:hypothetical protein